MLVPPLQSLKESTRIYLHKYSILELILLLVLLLGNILYDCSFIAADNDDIEILKLNTFTRALLVSQQQTNSITNLNSTR